MLLLDIVKLPVMVSLAVIFGILTVKVRTVANTEIPL
jgi:hypothetical protein